MGGNRVLRLIDSQCSAAWKLDVSEASPAELIDRSFENNSFSFELRHRFLEVVAHQVELVAGFVAGVEGDLGRGQGEDQPAVAGVDGVEAEDFFEEVAVRIGVFAVHDYVSSSDHAKQCKSARKDWEVGVLVAGLEGWGCEDVLDTRTFVW
jgi:hypothetical protein